MLDGITSRVKQVCVFNWVLQQTQYQHNLNIRGLVCPCPRGPFAKN